MLVAAVGGMPGGGEFYKSAEELIADKQLLGKIEKLLSLFKAGQESASRNIDVDNAMTEFLENTIKENEKRKMAEKEKAEIEKKYQKKGTIKSRAKGKVVYDRNLNQNLEYDTDSTRIITHKKATDSVP